MYMFDRDLHYIADRIENEMSDSAIKPTQASANGMFSASHALWG